MGNPFKFAAGRKRDSHGPILCQHPDGCNRAWAWIRLHGGRPDEFLCCAHAVEEYMLDVEAREARIESRRLHKSVNQPC